MENSSTPIRRNVRESLGFIKSNTVSKLVKAFSHNQKLSPTPRADSPIDVDVDPIVEFSTIYGSPECVNAKNEDSGYNSLVFSRPRSKTLGASSVNTNQRIAAYAAYPNFRWSQLKYFGMDPKVYMTNMNIDPDTISELLPDVTTINRDVNNGVDANTNEFACMRKRSRSCSVKPISKSNRSTCKKRKYFGVEKLADAMESDDVFVNHDDAIDPNAAVGSSGDPKTYQNRPTELVEELKIRIQKSINSYKSD